MKSFLLTYKDNEGNEKNVELRLKSSDCEKIEKQQNCSLIDFVQRVSVTNIVTMLQYMKEGGTGERVSREMAYSFYDELVDSGMSLLQIIDSVIYETLAVSGVISQDDLKNIREEKAKIENMTDEEKERRREERKNAQK